MIFQSLEGRPMLVLHGPNDPSSTNKTANPAHNVSTTRHPRFCLRRNPNPVRISAGTSQHQAGTSVTAASQSGCRQ
jgi:hypothetical protein